jgi:hypothetical protein
VHDQRVRLGEQGGAGRQLQVAGVHGLADLEAVHVHLDALGDVGGLGLDGHGDHLLVEHAVGDRLAGDHDGQLHGDPLAALHQQQVDVLQEALDRVALHALGQRDLVDAVALQADEHVRRAKRDHQVVAGEGEVLGLGAVAVQDGGNLVLSADLAGGALAELGALLGLDAYFGHG